MPWHFVRRQAYPLWTRAKLFPPFQSLPLIAISHRLSLLAFSDCATVSVSSPSPTVLNENRNHFSLNEELLKPKLKLKNNYRKNKVKRKKENGVMFLKKETPNCWKNKRKVVMFIRRPVCISRFPIPESTAQSSHSTPLWAHRMASRTEL